ncbi:MAG: tetratricopeptide repeat protein [Bacteroidetes bacterium]|nr:tetratricopeptide repeat protein [Bacteroidota bacterium]HET6244230.1 tetratricopeptide repeat protein [Bacteroidia bacterium]
MKKLLLLIFLFFSVQTFAQNAAIDSLKILLSNEKMDTTSVKLNNDISRKLINASDYENALKYANDAINLAKISSFFAKGENQRGVQKGIAVSLNNIGLIYTYQGNYPEALKNYLSSLKIREELGDKFGIASSLNNIGYIYSNQGNYPEALKNHLASLKIREELGDKKGNAGSLINIGLIYTNQGNYPEALKNYLSSLKIDEELGDKKGISVSLNNIGNIYSYQGNHPEALKNYLASLKIREELGDKKGIASSLNNIGNVYSYQGNYPEGLKNLLSSLKIMEELGDKKGNASTLNNIGGVYSIQGNYPEALKNFLASLKIREELGDKNGISSSLNNIGNVYTKTGKAEEGKKYILKSLQLSNEIGALDIVVKNYQALAQADSALGNYQSALENYKQYILYRDSLLNEENTKKTMQQHMQFDFDKKEAIALAEFEKQQQLSAAELEKRNILLVKNKQSLVILEQDNELRTLALAHSTAELKQKESFSENQKKEIELLNKDNLLKQAQAAKKEEELKKQRIATYAAAGGGMLILVVLAFALKAYRNKRRSNLIIIKQKQEVEKQKTAVEQQKQVIEEKQKEILDSINYAKRIQTAILPPQRIVKQYLPDSFIIYKPKDIVAGDFYWLETVQLNDEKIIGLADGKRKLEDHQQINTSANQLISTSAHQQINTSSIQQINTSSNQLILFAAADCTGHGVPGAMVSVICNNGLNRSVREYGITDPGKILDKTREIVIQEFEKSDDEVKDGMDISLCALQGNTLHWAGANNPLWIIRSNEIIEYRADKQPIGKYAENKLFTTHSIELQKNDNLYIFTDGFADQFGGEQGKKFKSANFKKLLLSIQSETMERQKEIISETFSFWKGSLEQIDDVCIIGVRL